jgi:lipopolysaccharide cholinephosphotransferase
MKNELTLREIQKSSLDILKEVDFICKKLNLDYFIMYGTLIGAIRHKGFIPWDDDLDIMMPRPDYNRLIDYFSAHESKHLKLLNYNNCDLYPYMITRISDTRFKIIVENEEEYGIGTFIDVYPLDSISNYKFIALIKGRVLGWLSSLYFLSTRINCPIPCSESKHRHLLKLVSFRISKLIGKRFLKKLLLINKYEKTKYMACMQWMTNDYKRNIFETDLISGRTSVSFEEFNVPVPLRFHEILKKYYGDYMQFPPKELQKPHHLYKAYRIK